MTLRSFKNANAKHFGAIVQRIRKERGMSVSQLARHASANYRHMLVLERGDNTPTLQMIFDVADALHVKASDIIAEIDAARSHT